MKKGGKKQQNKKQHKSYFITGLTGFVSGKVLRHAQIFHTVWDENKNSVVIFGVLVSPSKQKHS